MRAKCPSTHSVVLSEVPELPQFSIERGAATRYAKRYATRYERLAGAVEIRLGA